jgi:HAD superfamily hydrolase (TIGR01549 family)
LRTVVGPPAPPSTARVDAVLIDMDDTLFDHSLTCRAAIASLRSGRGYLRRRPLDGLWREYLGLLGSDAARITSYVGRPGLSVDQARTDRWRRLARGCGEELTPAAASELSHAYRDRYQRLRRGVPGARELLRALHARAKVVVVTNNEVAEQEEKVRFLGIGAWVDGLVVSEAVGVAKPDPKIFEAALAAAGTPSGRATMLGDSWTSDIVGARGAGLRAVWFNRFGQPQPGPFRVEELRSLRPLRAARGTLLGEERPSVQGSAPSPPSAL